MHANTATALRPIKNKISSLVCLALIAAMFLQIAAPAVIFAQSGADGRAALTVDDARAEVNRIYKQLQSYNSLNTGLKIEFVDSPRATYQNDGKTLKVSTALVAKLFQVDGGKGMPLFIAREISYAENIRAGFEGFQLEYLSDKAGLIVANNARYDVGAGTFNSILKAVEADPAGDSRDKIRALKIGVSQYVTPSDLARLMSNKMRRGVTIKKGIEAGKIGQLTGWQPILKNAVGGAFSNVATYYGLNVASNMLDGYPISESLKKAVKTTFTPEYLVGGLAGSVVGGAVGSLVGSLIPVPGAGPIVSAFIGAAPAIFGANLGSEIGTNAILDYKRNKSVSLKRVWDAMDVSYLVGHSLGMAAGMAIGSALIPIPIVGGFVGGVVGGLIGAKISKAVANVYYKLSGKAKEKIAAGADARRPSITLPWLKKADAGAVTEAGAESGLRAASETGSGSRELIAAQKKVSETYQKYVKLLSSEPAESPKLKAALDEFTSASERFNSLKQKTEAAVSNLDE